MADRSRPNGGDFGWKYELTSGDEYPLASLRTGRVSRSRPCRAENGKPTRSGTRASLHRPGDYSQRAGARESTFFSARLSNYNAFLVSLTNLFRAGLDLSRYRVEQRLLDHIRQEAESLQAAISDEF